MATLTQQQKLYLIGRLACFDSPTEISKAAKQEIGVEIGTSQICSYDPTTANGGRLSAELKQVFEETRARFLADVTLIPIANQSYRLRRMQQIIDDSSNRKNPGLVLSILEQAAKEVGGMFTNRRELNGPNGGAVPLTLQAAIDIVYGKEGSDDGTD